MSRVSTTVPQPLGSLRLETRSPAALRVTPARCLAIFGALIAVYEAITWARWLAAGPTQITQYRDHGAAAWTLARIYEPLVTIVGSGLLVRAVRQCRASGRLTL